MREMWTGARLNNYDPLKKTAAFVWVTVFFEWFLYTTLKGIFPSYSQPTDQALCMTADGRPGGLVSNVLGTLM